LAQYGPEAGPARELDEAKNNDWIVISMKQHWKRVFAFE
jgi:hypothetical protein